ncbi:hypothetical protein BV22DRAFT_1166095 [Leucogyrophana mollusca]|uniref:Uncharacterized protein n=1 Tax=Leucogyrophana mollusca TaxID=85980 RepID=A0ACB8BI26_9AGAM|nr:hypothetical protein BV22DRAFT_1166095 [Leucogyrophana mollusca]
MHSRNPYRNPPDFAALARQYLPLKPYVSSAPNGTSTIDFKDPVAQRRLTEALLQRDFDIQLTLPDDRLCPPCLPSRLNYVLWLQDIIEVVSSKVDVVRGVDIGTGASAIYPLLACKLDPSWIMTATDIDEASLRSARANVERNNLCDRITVLQAAHNDPIFSLLDVDINTQFDFTMCNPPFYSSAEEIASSSDAKEYGPSAVCTGVDVEMITPGGESEFVTRMVTESLRHKSRCRWFTSMLGKMSTVPVVVALLRLNKIDNYAITEFVQGQTRRWAIAWSFGTSRLPDTLARISQPALQAIMPSRNTLRQPFPDSHSVEHLAEALKSVLELIDGVRYTPVEAVSTDCRPSAFTVEAATNSWSRAARRRKASVEDGQTLMPTFAALRCRIECLDNSWPGSGERRVVEGPRFKLEFVWVEGKERTFFESFVSHVSKKVGLGILAAG